jgi:HK97 family phage major capsid protein
MKDYKEQMILTGSPAYDWDFWLAMRGNAAMWDRLADGAMEGTNTYAMPNAAQNKFADALKKHSVFRNIATVINAYNVSYRILARDTTDLAQWVPENGEIPLYDGMDDFTQYPVDSHKLAAFIKLDEDFVRDASFDIENYLTQRFAKNFGKAEDDGFINGTGTGAPTGILAQTHGAEIGRSTSTLSFDDIVQLYFSVKPEYRDNATWLMNDETALYLRGLKDDTGNYLWRGGADTLLGKPVKISTAMPSVATDAKPVAFGDFSYYWVVPRMPVSVRTLVEKFALYGQVGYLAFEFLDGKLVRPEAVKVIQITA